MTHYIRRDNELLAACLKQVLADEQKEQRATQKLAKKIAANEKKAQQLAKRGAL